MNAARTLPNASRVSVETIEVPGATANHVARLYRADPARVDDILLVFFSGGAFSSCDLEGTDSCMEDMVSGTGIAVLAPTYALAPQHPFPAAAEDAWATLNWTGEAAKRLGWSGRTLIVGGVEAGGNLAAVASMMARDRGGPVLAAQLLFAPMLDPGLSTPSMRSLADNDADLADACESGYRDYLPRPADRVHPYACPLRSRRLSGLPPALILSIEDDPLRDEAELYSARLNEAGVHSRHVRLPAAQLNEPEERCDAVQETQCMSAVIDFIKTFQPAS